MIEILSEELETKSSHKERELLVVSCLYKLYSQLEVNSELTSQNGPKDRSSCKYTLFFSLEKTS